MNYIDYILITAIVVGICAFIFDRFQIPGKEKFSSGALWTGTLIMALMGFFLLFNDNSYGMVEDSNLHHIQVLIGISFLLIACLGPIQIFKHKRFLRKEGVRSPAPKITAFGLIMSGIGLIVLIFIIVEIILAYRLPH